MEQGTRRCGAGIGHCRRSRRTWHARLEPQGEPRTQHGRTPHHLINGTFTPNGLHFVISHPATRTSIPANIVWSSTDPSGVPRVHPRRAAPLSDGVAYELSSNAGATAPDCSRANRCRPTSRPFTASCRASEGTGVMLSTLLDEAGIDPKAKWLIAEGADSLALSRSVPIVRRRRRDDRLYQTRERIDARQRVSNAPRYRGGRQHECEISAPPQAGRAAGHELRGATTRRSFRAARRISSIFCRGSNVHHAPSPGLRMNVSWFYEISGVAYSANGRIAKVMVSADGGKQGKRHCRRLFFPKAIHAFPSAVAVGRRAVVLQSAWDEGGNVQPTRAEVIASRSDVQAPHKPRWDSPASITTGRRAGGPNRPARCEMCTRRTPLTSAEPQRHAATEGGKKNLAPCLRVPVARACLLAAVFASTVTFAQNPLNPA